ncbi:hypothetical protein SDC9_185056 [bioreactor metagenome]|uniref:Uncharacterized protein n=1 Tax=bioreactor metagenome TaxID=1076179 RepID=A0A645HG42_9ZZZZ
MRPRRDDQVGNLKCSIHLVQGVAKLFCAGLLQETDERIENGRDVSLTEGLKLIAVSEVADDETKNSFAVSRVTGVSVDPKREAFAGLVVSTVGRFKLAGLHQSCGHLVEECLDHQHAAGVCLATNVTHQVLVILMKLTHG